MKKQMNIFFFFLQIKKNGVYLPQYINFRGIVKLVKTPMSVSSSLESSFSVAYRSFSGFKLPWITFLLWIYWIKRSKSFLFNEFIIFHHHVPQVLQNSFYFFNFFSEINLCMVKRCYLKCKCNIVYSFCSISFGISTMGGQSLKQFTTRCQVLYYVNS